MLNLSQTVVDNLSPDGQLEVARHALNAAQATIRDLAEQLVGAKVLMRAEDAALRVSQSHVDQLLAQVKEQAADIKSLRRALADTDSILASKARTIQRQAAQLDKLQVETTKAQSAARGHDQMIDLLAGSHRVWDAMVGTHWSAEVDDDILAGQTVAAIKRIKSETGFSVSVCRALIQKRAEYL